jgi:putative colanic acid biosynthesis acetyltransferase WcaF
MWHSWRALIARAFGAQIGRHVHIYPRAKIWAPWMLTAGEYATIADGAEIYNAGGVTLGHHAIVSQDSFLCGATHDINDPEFPFVSRPISVDAYGWVCARAIVLPGVHIGAGAVLAAGAVARKNVPEWTVFAGNPAKQVSTRVRIK